MNKHLLLSILLINTFLAACSSSSPTRKALAEDAAEAAKIRAQSEHELRNIEQKKLEEDISRIPSWALESPRSDATGIYAVGIGESDTVRIALRKATLDAEFGLAKSYGQELSGSERSFTQDSYGRTTGSQYTELIDKLVAQIPVNGFDVVHQDVKAINGKYNAYILLKLPYDQFNLVLKAQASRNAGSSIEKQFTNLERLVEKRRKQRAEEAKQEAQQIADTQKPASGADGQRAERKTSAPTASVTASAADAPHSHPDHEE